MDNIKYKYLYLGCGPSPVHPQHIQVMGNPDEWTFVDLYIQEPHIKNWDCTTLEEVKDNSVERIYSSHLLEHLPHPQLPDILRTWRDKLIDGGDIYLNVPDITWACEQILSLESGQFLDGYFNQFEGEHGLQSVLFGTEVHPGEYHKSAFTRSSLQQLLQSTGYKDIVVSQTFDAHDMGVLIAIARK